MPEITITSQAQLDVIERRWGRQAVVDRGWCIGFMLNVSDSVYTFLYKYRRKDASEPWVRPDYANPEPLPVALP